MIHRTARGLAAALLVTSLALTAAAGPYSQSWDDAANPYDAPVPGFVGPDGDGACLADGPNNHVNPAFLGWAARVVDYTPAPPADPPYDTTEYATRRGVAPGFDNAQTALGPVTGNTADCVSLGDLYGDQIAAGVAPGSITLGFDLPIANGPGGDLAVFENSFYSAGTWAELAYVEVSTDGATFARFPSGSLTSDPVGPYGPVDATDIHNLAGKHVNAYGASWGTPFDLDDLADHDDVMAGLVDLMAIRYVRIVDVPGSGDFADSDGRPIYDSWTTWGSGGFDLDAVGVLNSLVRGDFNGDGALNGLDIPDFKSALADPETWSASHGRNANLLGDFSGDGVLNGLDIPGFKSALSGVAIPEPGTIVALASALVLGMRRK